MIKKIMMFAVAFALVACEGEDLSKVNKPNGGGNTPTGENATPTMPELRGNMAVWSFPDLNRVLIGCCYMQQPMAF